MTTIKTDAGPISREDYISRAAATFRAEGGLDAESAREQAGILADNSGAGEVFEDMSPEDAAAEEMSNWTADEGAATGGA